MAQRAKRIPKRVEASPPPAVALLVPSFFCATVLAAHVVYAAHALSAAHVADVPRPALAAYAPASTAEFESFTLAAADDDADDDAFEDAEVQRSLGSHSPLAKRRTPTGSSGSPELSGSPRLLADTSQPIAWRSVAPPKLAPERSSLGPRAPPTHVLPHVQ